MVFRRQAGRLSVERSSYGRLRETLGLVPMRIVSVLTALEARPSNLVTGRPAGILLVYATYAMPGDGVQLSGRPGGPA